MFAQFRLCRWCDSCNYMALPNGRPAFGFDTGVRSFPYVALWAQDKKLLEQNLGAIRGVATRMIEGIEQVKTQSVGSIP